MLIIDSLDLCNREQFEQVAKAAACYVKDLNVKVNNYRGQLQIIDLSNAMQSGKQCNVITFDFWHHPDHPQMRGFYGLNHFLDDYPFADVVNNWRNGFKYQDTEFCSYMGVSISYGAKEAKKVFTPFLQPKKQNLENGKNGRVRIITFVKALLAGQIKEIICDGKYTDDYYYDHVTNYSKGKRMDLQTFAEELLQFSGFCIWKDGNNPDTLNIAFNANDFYRASIK